MLNIQKLAVVGSRNFSDYDRMRAAILEHVNLESLRVIVSGGAVGADSLGERFADEFGLEKEIYPANWKMYGRGAGQIRNRKIAAACDACIAFPVGESKGTKGTIARCEKLGKPLIVITQP